MLHPIVCYLPFHPGLLDHGNGPVGHLQGGWAKPDRERNAGFHGECCWFGAVISLSHLVAGDRLSAELPEEEATQCRQQDAKAEE